MNPAATPSAEARPLRPRAPGLSFTDPSVPRYWFDGLRHATLLVDAVNLLFPKGERFFVRSVVHHLPRIEDASLRAQVRGFAGQEGKHAKAHEDFAAVMETHGYRMESFMRWYQRIAYDTVERAAPPALRLATTAACEHFTAMLAEEALTEGFLEKMHPAMGRLLRWHAAEEIEHKAVAFDVLRLVAPGYPLRLAGLGLATTLLGGFWVAALVDLHRQDAKLPPAPSREATAEELAKGPLGVFVRGILDYARPSFHPDDHDNRALAAAALQHLGLEPS